MRLIQFNVYFSHHLHIFMLSYITNIVRVHARDNISSALHTVHVHEE